MIVTPVFIALYLYASLVLSGVARSQDAMARWLIPGMLCLVCGYALLIVEIALFFSELMESVARVRLPYYRAFGEVYALTDKQNLFYIAIHTTAL